MDALPWDAQRLIHEHLWKPVMHELKRLSRWDVVVDDDQLYKYTGWDGRPHSLMVWPNLAFYRWNWIIDYDDRGLIECARYGEYWPDSDAAYEAGVRYLVENVEQLKAEVYFRHVDIDFRKRYNNGNFAEPEPIKAFATLGSSTTI